MGYCPAPGLLQFQIHDDLKQQETWWRVVIELSLQEMGGSSALPDSYGHRTFGGWLCVLDIFSSDLRMPKLDPWYETAFWGMEKIFLKYRNTSSPQGEKNMGPIPQYLGL